VKPLSEELKFTDGFIS